jgi:hypothetical protein
LLHRYGEGFLQGFLSRVEITEQPDQRGQHLPRLGPEDLVNLGAGFY